MRQPFGTRNAERGSWLENRRRPLADTSSFSIPLIAGKKITCRLFAESGCAVSEEAVEARHLSAVCFRLVATVLQFARSQSSPPLALAAGYPRRLPVAAGWCWLFV